MGFRITAVLGNQVHANQLSETSMLCTRLLVSFKRYWPSLFMDDGDQSWVKSIGSAHSAAVLPSASMKESAASESLSVPSSRPWIAARWGYAPWPFALAGGATLLGFFRASSNMRKTHHSLSKSSRPRTPAAHPFVRS